MILIKVIFYVAVHVCFRFQWHEATRSISTPPWMGCQSIEGLPPSIKFAGTHLYTWVERGTVRVKCLAQEHNTMSPARARTRTARSGDERTNHEATAPPFTPGKRTSNGVYHTCNI